MRDEDVLFFSVFCLRILFFTYFCKRENLKMK